VAGWETGTPRQIKLGKQLRDKYLLIDPSEEGDKSIKLPELKLRGKESSESKSYRPCRFALSDSDVSFIERNSLIQVHVNFKLFISFVVVID
jgi:hypothetical protein